jgi:hypothetical protein
MKRTADKKATHKILGLDNHKKAKRAQSKSSRYAAKEKLWEQWDRYCRLLELS